MTTLSQDLVLERCAFLQSIGVWKRQRLMNPEVWLGNFTSDEHPTALALLSSFLYFCEELTDELVIASVRGLAPTVTETGKEYADKRYLWQQFLYSVRITHVVPEKYEGDQTKSGYLYMRKARQLLGATTDQVTPVPRLLADLSWGDTTPVLVLDDFAGSAEDFLDGYTRRYDVGAAASLSDAREAGTPVYFCPTVATSLAMEHIAALGTRAPMVNPAHTLQPSMSLLHPDSDVLTDEDARRALPQLLREVAERTGSEEPAFGYHDLGLGLSFAHGTPDATLPIFWSEDGGWRPLVRRN